MVRGFSYGQIVRPRFVGEWANFGQMAHANKAHYCRGQSSAPRWPCSPPLRGKSDTPKHAQPRPIAAPNAVAVSVVRVLCLMPNQDEPRRMRDEGRVLRRAVGEERAHSYGKNMAGCTRTVLEQDVYTALYGFGAGLPVTDEDGRYTRRPASKPS